MGLLRDPSKHLLSNPSMGFLWSACKGREGNASKGFFRPSLGMSAE